jgi:hypothetical protein
MMFVEIVSAIAFAVTYVLPQILWAVRRGR